MDKFTWRMEKSIFYINRRCFNILLRKSNKNRFKGREKNRKGSFRNIFDNFDTLRPFKNNNKCGNICDAYSNRGFK